MLAAAVRTTDGHPGRTCGLSGLTAEERANVFSYQFNDVASVERAIEEAGRDDVAAIVVSPFRHDAGLRPGTDRSRVRPRCTRVVRPMRGGAHHRRGEGRLPFAPRWQLGAVRRRPRLCSAWSKAIGNGYPIAAVLGNHRFRRGAERIFATGSFWYQAVPMAAAIATIHALRDEAAIEAMVRAGTLLRAGLDRQSLAYGIPINQTSPVQMPNVSFDDDNAFEKAMAFCATAIKHGAILHPRHNWFLCAAHTDADIERVLSATDEGFRRGARALRGRVMFTV